MHRDGRTRNVRVESLESRRVMASDLLPAIVATATGGEGEEPTTTTQVADFSLVDSNPNSATFNRVVSPRQYLEQVSVWYFGHAS